LKQLQIAIVLLCGLSYAAAGTASIGTASARGDMQVDSHTVYGNATLFDGSVIETGQAAAELRLEKGTEIVLGAKSSCTIHRDRLVLQQGVSELATATSFQLEANGLRVTPNEPNSHGVVSVSSATSVDVSTLQGSFRVTNDQGVVLTSVRPGLTLSFAMQAGAGTKWTFTTTGKTAREAGVHISVQPKNWAGP
jgi:hypothetical protein